MRVFRPVLRGLSAGILVLIVLLLAAFPAVSADTGTYRINNYLVTLDPQSDGRVKITYEQDWQVLTGDIPWVTVGTANSNFTVQSSGGNAATVYAYNTQGFTGVRIDLNKDYLPGQTFHVKFTLLQSNLLEKLTGEGKWRINFTPGWYDNAVISHLQINLASPIPYDEYSAVTPPTAVNGNVISWENVNLSPGTRVTTKVESPNGNFLSPSVPVTKSGISTTTLIIIVAIVIILGLVIFWGIKKSREDRDAELKERIITVEAEMAEDKAKKQKIEDGFEKYVEKEKIQPDAEGRYYDRGYGDYITPAIWAAVILPHSEQKPPAGGTTTIGGHCACVACACACACACAGGGAAG